MDSSNKRQIITGNAAVGVQIEGDHNRVSIFAGEASLYVDRPHQRRRVVSPTSDRQFLITESRATELVGRENLLSALAEWRDTEAPGSVHCLFGAAGSGKTRLAIEACEAAEAADWLAGFVSGDELRRFSSRGNFGQWRWSGDTLLVVDDASSNVRILKEWLGSITHHLDDCRGRIRILLLDRQVVLADDRGWWAELSRVESFARAEAADLIGASRPEALAPISGLQERRALFEQSLCIAARLRGKDVPDLPPVGARPDFDKGLVADHADKEPLFLMMAGIVAAELDAHTALSLNRVALAEQMASAERARLARLGKSQGLPEDGDLIAHLAACITLERGVGLSSLLNLVTVELQSLGWRAPLGVERIAQILLDALPSAGSGVDGISPDLIGETFVLREITGPRVRLDVTRDTIVARALGRAPDKVAQTLIQGAQDLAAGSTSHPYVRWLRMWALGISTPRELAALLGQMPSNTLALRELNLELYDRLLALDMEGDSDPWLRAAALCNLSIARRANGDFAGALIAAEESVATMREVAKSDLRCRDRLCHSLQNLACSLTDSGEADRAVDVAQEAVNLWHELFRPEDFFEDGLDYTPGYASAVMTLAQCAARAGKLEGAIAAAEQGALAYQYFAEADPEHYLADFARALIAYSGYASEHNCHDVAQGVAGLAIGRVRALAAALPDSHRPLLAECIEHLARCEFKAGRPDLAYKTAQEPLAIYRELATERPQIFEPSLAWSLNNLSAYLVEAGALEAALEPANEAIQIKARLAELYPQRYRHDLAGAYNNIGAILARLGRLEDAMGYSIEAAEIYGKLSEEQPTVFEPLFSGALLNLGTNLHALGRSEEALPWAEQAVLHYRALAETYVSPYRPQLAMALAVLANVYEANSRLDDALLMDHQAIWVLKPLFIEFPAAYRKDMFDYVMAYGKRCRAADVKPDLEMLMPVVEVFDRLDEEQYDGN